MTDELFYGPICLDCSYAWRFFDIHGGDSPNGQDYIDYICNDTQCQFCLALRRAADWVYHPSCEAAFFSAHWTFRDTHPADECEWIYCAWCDDDLLYTELAQNHNISEEQVICSKDGVLPLLVV